MLIEFPRLFTIVPWWNDRRCTAAGNLRHQGIGVKGFIRYHRLCGNVLQQRWRLHHVVHLPAGQAPTRQLAQAFHQRMDLRAQPTARAPQGLVAFFWAHRPHVDGHGQWCCRERLLQSRHPGPTPRTPDAKRQRPTNAQTACTRCSKHQRPWVNRAKVSLSAPPTARLQQTGDYPHRFARGRWVCRGASLQSVPIGHHEVFFLSSHQPIQ
jgi:hypothetical protein